ncbi:MAG: hypothetical protein MUE73_13965 [Planctomycetes bacterium]|jgi:hypothetical protein|nr:hypothetical protein [Planctomycetota bacterium]
MSRSTIFSAVALKEAIQEKRRRERSSLSDEETRRDIMHRLETSDHPLAALWRRSTGRKPKRNPARA